jgi:hypothetical protein
MIGFIGIISATPPDVVRDMAGTVGDLIDDTFMLKVSRIYPGPIIQSVAPIQNDGNGTNKLKPNWPVNRIKPIPRAIDSTIPIPPWRSSNCRKGMSHSEIRLTR